MELHSLEAGRAFQKYDWGDATSEARRDACPTRLSGLRD